MRSDAPSDGGYQRLGAAVCIKAPRLKLERRMPCHAFGALGTSASQKKHSDQRRGAVAGSNQRCHDRDQPHARAWRHGRHARGAAGVSKPVLRDLTWRTNWSSAHMRVWAVGSGRSRRRKCALSDDLCGGATTRCAGVKHDTTGCFPAICCKGAADQLARRSSKLRAINCGM